jgi:hypothetical protein
LFGAWDETVSRSGLFAEPHWSAANQSPLERLADFSIKDGLQFSPTPLEHSDFSHGVEAGRARRALPPAGAPRGPLVPRTWNTRGASDAGWHPVTPSQGFM